MSETRMEVHPEHQHRSPAEIASEEALSLGCLHVPVHKPAPRIVRRRPVPAHELAEPPAVPHGPHPTHCEP